MSGTGRAGKVAVERRLLTARHGALLLDRKQRIMADELDRLQLQADRIRSDWEKHAREAAAWLRRAAALDGSEAIAAAAPGAPAEIEFEWGGAMGVTYPEDASCDPPVVPPPGGSSALSYAVAAHRTALQSAVRQAAIDRAIRLVSAELTATRARQRAVEKRWIPRLENELLAIRRHLDEQELEESLRLRWAADQKTTDGRASGGAGPHETAPSGPAGRSAGQERKETG